jgi:hypothetical protein
LQVGTIDRSLAFMTSPPSQSMMRRAALE